MNLLSVDFDFFFPELSLDPKLWTFYDWGHRDAGKFFLEDIWYNRAACFLQHGMELPGLSGDQVGFWDRFRFAENTELFFADSHMYAGSDDVVMPARFHAQNRVVNFDAHHDCGYTGTMKDWLATNRITCEDWMCLYHYAAGAKCKVVYPTWKSWAMTCEKPSWFTVTRKFDNGKPVLQKFDRIFVCRSGGWVPSWLESEFTNFIEACPVAKKTNLDGMTPRVFDDARLQAELTTQSKLDEMFGNKMAVASV